MSEIKKEIKQNADGSYTITDAHSTADIVRWLLTQDSKETILYLLNETLAQPEQEPVAWMREDEMKAMTSLEKDAWIECGRGELVGDYNKPLGYLSEGGAERLLTKKQAIEHIKNFKLFAHDVPIYTTPPQRTWVGLTREEAKEICLANRPYVVDMAIALEAELKKRNGFTDEGNT